MQKLRMLLEHEMRTSGLQQLVREAGASFQTVFVTLVFSFCSYPLFYGPFCTSLPLKYYISFGTTFKWVPGVILFVTARVPITNMQM